MDKYNTNTLYSTNNVVLEYAKWVYENTFILFYKCYDRTNLQNIWQHSFINLYPQKFITIFAHTYITKFMIFYDIGIRLN